MRTKEQMKEIKRLTKRITEAKEYIDFYKSDLALQEMLLKHEFNLTHKEALEILNKENK